MTAAPKRLYHFTAAHLLDGIRIEGLTRGSIPMSLNPPALHTGWQWLTESADFAQSWCERRISIPYRRDDVRFTIRIPAPSRGLLRKWSESHSLTPLAGLLSEYGDPDNWWLFHGRIPPSWIRATDWNPLAPQAQP